MERTKTVIALLKAADWDPFAVPNWLEEFRLPDAQYAERKPYRSKWVASYTFPNGVGGENKNDPAYRDVACYTGIYARSNPTYYPGDKARFKPSGFYIVGWKDGRVTKVPLQDVRWSRGEKEKAILSFPGMPNYDPKGFGLAYVQFPNGFPSREAETAYLSAVSGSCKGCKD